VLFSARWIDPAAQVDPAPPLDVGRARAWVINEDALVGESLVRRLQRLGWATTKFVTPEGAIRQMRTLQPDRARPSLVIGVESRSFDLPAARALRAVLPPWTRCIYAVASGSVSLLLHRDVLAWDVLVRPLSPAQLAQISVEAVPQAEPGSGHTLPAPLSMAQRPRLVVVDDDELNRVVVGGIAQTLGYEVSTAPGGAEGIELCRRRCPEVVLMDLCMQPMDGFETTRRLRGLERAGAIAPCRIVAVTAETQAEVQLECLRAGMDGFVAKPVLAGELSDELRRVFTGCGVAAPMQRDLPAPRTPLETADHIGRRTQAVTTQANPGV
jgi:CheY-like chemotaxis protein